MAEQKDPELASFGGHQNYNCLRAAINENDLKTGKKDLL